MAPRGRFPAMTLATVEPASSPKTKGDEVSLMFDLFDWDRNGKVSMAEMKRVLQTLDKERWSDERVAKVLSAYDDNGDGDLQFTEFWGWVCGHGGRSTSDFKPALLGKAIEDDRRRRALNEERARRAQERKAAKERLAAEQEVKEQQRAAGQRLTKAQFIEVQRDIGLSEEVALELFKIGDEDADGDIDQQERMWLAGEHAATTGQIRTIYIKGAGSGAIDDKGNLSLKDVEEQGMKAIVEAFTKWDVDGDGSISPAELQRVLSTLNPKLGEKTVEALSREMDINKDGSIDIMEFVGWLSGESTKKKKMKKKAKEEAEAKIAVALHRRRAEEARDLRIQDDFQDAEHKILAKWLEKKKIVPTCNTLMRGPGARQMCTACFSRHAWLCHGCGFVSYYEECVNGCPAGKGWSCIAGKCVKKCGCKKPPEFWQRMGCIGELSQLSHGVRRIIEAANKVPEPPPPPPAAEEPPAAEQP